MITVLKLDHAIVFQNGMYLVDVLFHEDKCII